MDLVAAIPRLWNVVWDYFLSKVSYRLLFDLVLPSNT